MIRVQTEVGEQQEPVHEWLTLWAGADTRW